MSIRAMDPVVVSTVVYSCILALIALGFTLQYLVMGIPNLAHPTIAFSSTYLTLTATLVGLTPYTGVLPAALFGGGVSFLLYKFLASLKRKGVSLVGLMIATLVFQFIIFGLTNIYSEYIAYGLKAYTSSFILTQYDFALFGLPGILFVSMLTLASLATSFHLALTKTKFGVATRAIVENEPLAKVDGVNVDRVLSISWFFVGAVAGISGALYPLWFSMDPNVGTVMLASVFAASVVGGIRSIYGTLAGGIVVAVTEIGGSVALSGFFGPVAWAYRAAFPILATCIVLLGMPEGLGGFFSRFRKRRKTA
jgi:branched-chain amino acid transport system permease protein